MNNTINVVMMVYKRIYRFDEVLESLSDQTVDFTLHIISNNQSLNSQFLEVITKYRDQGMDIKFFEADNSRRTAERWFYTRDNLLDCEYVIFLDDDAILHSDDIEKIWNCREKNTMKVLEGRKFFSQFHSGPITKVVYQTTLSPYHDQFSYGALNFGIMETAIFQPDAEIFQIEKEDPDLCYRADDLVLSWVVHKNGGRIINHNVAWIDTFGADEYAIHKEIGNDIYLKYQELDNKHRFKRFDV